MKIKDTIPLYLNHLKALGRSKKTVKGAKYDLHRFEQFLKEEGAFDLEDLTAELLSDYQQSLSFSLTAKGSLMTLRSQAQLLGAAKGFTRFLKKMDYLLNDPGEKIKLPRKPKTLPRSILTTSDIRKLLHVPDMGTYGGFRNRLILEILYDTAIRRDELSSIELPHLDLEAGFIHITGKGSKDRVVPLSRRVCDLTKSYILSVRPTFIRKKDTGHLILNRWGRRMDGGGIWRVVKACASSAGIEKNITTHGIRHTCATHMLKNGAPVRHLQEMLGHESLESTQIYTRVTISDLKEVHAKYHPSEREE